jgi:hypothetical protein
MARGWGDQCLVFRGSNDSKGELFGADIDLQSSQRSKWALCTPSGLVFPKGLSINTYGKLHHARVEWRQRNTKVACGGKEPDSLFLGSVIVKCCELVSYTSTAPSTYGQRVNISPLVSWPELCLSTYSSVFISTSSLAPSLPSAAVSFFASFSESTLSSPLFSLPSFISSS